MNNLVNVIEKRRLSSYGIDSNNESHNLSTSTSKHSHLCYSLKSYEKLAIENGIEFLEEVISGFNPINGGFFEEDSFYRDSDTIHYLKDVCELFAETESVNYVRFSEASSYLNIIYNSVIPMDPYEPDAEYVENDFYGKESRQVFIAIRDLLAKHCIPIIVH